MKILYIHQYFNTPQEPGGTRSYWFSKELINAGHEVIMFTSGRRGQDKFIEKKYIEGITVIYVRNAYNNKMPMVQRLWSFLKFMIYAIRFGLEQKKIDLVYATSTPLSVALPAIVIKKLKCVPFIFEVRDLWPEVPIQMGALKNKFLIKILYWFEKKVYQSAAHVVALSPGMKEGVIKYGIPEQKVSMIPNMSKKDEFYQRPKNKEIATSFNINLNKFNAVHFGTMGLANGLEYLLDAAALLKSKNIENIELLFLGAGSTEAKLKEKCKTQNLTNVKFLGRHPMKTVSEIVNICDVSIVPFSNLPILYTNSPNKLFDSLSAAKPIIVNSAGWTKDMVEENHCGVYVDPQNPEALANALIDLSNAPEMVAQMSKNSRTLATEVYDKSILCKSFYALIQSFDTKHSNHSKRKKTYK